MNAYEKFNKVMDDYSEYGTCDTEPRDVVRDMVRHAFNGTKRIPTTNLAWQIYSTKEGSNEVAAKLTEAATELVDHIQSISIRNMDEEKEKAASAFWIDDWEIWP